MGAMHELGQANTKLPKGMPATKASVKGCGSTGPDPKGDLFLPNGCKVRFHLPPQKRRSLFKNGFG